MHLLSFLISIALVYGQRGILGEGWVATGMMGKEGDQCGSRANQTLENYFGAMESKRKVYRGTTERFVWQSYSNSSAGPLSVQYDQACSGAAFLMPLAITKNVDGQDGYTPQPFFTDSIDVEIPPDMQCDCPDNLCLVQFRNPYDVVSCVFVTVQDSSSSKKTTKRKRKSTATKA